jgi:hypothetical protein
MKIYQVDYISFEGHNTEMFFCNKAEAEKWIKEHRDHFDFIEEPSLVELKSTRKRDIVNFINFWTAKA